MSKRKPKATQSAYRSIRFVVLIKGYGTRNSHRSALNRMIRSHFASGSRVI